MYKDEQSFKKAHLDYMVKEEKKFNECYAFEIESPGTAKGFPDVIFFSFVPYEHGTTLYEYKITDKKGFFEFEKSQIPFYLKYQELDIRLVLYDMKETFYDFKLCETILEYFKEQKRLRFSIKELQEKVFNKTYLEGKNISVFKEV